jgi:hypothetical protein
MVGPTNSNNGWTYLLHHRYSKDRGQGTEVDQHQQLDEVLTGSATAKNSKGLLINKIIDFISCWNEIIVSLCFTPEVQVSYVKMTMIESIAQVYKNFKRLNWEEHLADTIRINCKECQDSSKAIKFPSLLIWLEMEKYSLVEEPIITAKKVPTMEKYRVFSSNQTCTPSSLPP